MTQAALPPPEWNDASGRPITQGCLIAYSAGLGRSAVLKFGLVTELVSKPDKRWAGHGQYIDVVVPKIKAITSFSGTIQKSGGATTLEHLKRMLVVTEDQVPPEDLKAMRNAWQGVDP